MTKASGRAEAMALRLAKDYLEKMGWKYTPADIGTKAQEILCAMLAERSSND